VAIKRCDGATAQWLKMNYVIQAIGDDNITGKTTKNNMDFAFEPLHL
jgi:hypothetical protein